MHAFIHTYMYVHTYMHAFIHVCTSVYLKGKEEDERDVDAPRAHPRDDRQHRRPPLFVSQVV